MTTGSPAPGPPPKVVVPTVWPGDRFDIIGCFTLAANDVAAYQFTALPELLLPGDGPA